MRAQEFIIEVFDKPYKGHWEKSDYGRDLLVKLPDGIVTGKQIGRAHV